MDSPFKFIMSNFDDNNSFGFPIIENEGLPAGYAKNAASKQPKPVVEQMPLAMPTAAEDVTSVPPNSNYAQELGEFMKLLRPNTAGEKVERITPKLTDILKLYNYDDTQRAADEARAEKRAWQVAALGMLANNKKGLEGIGIGGLQGMNYYDQQLDKSKKDAADDYARKIGAYNLINTTTQTDSLTQSRADTKQNQENAQFTANFNAANAAVKNMMDLQNELVKLEQTGKYYDAYSNYLNSGGRRSGGETPSYLLRREAYENEQAQINAIADKLEQQYPGQYSDPVLRKAEATRIFKTWNMQTPQIEGYTPTPPFRANTNPEAGRKTVEDLLKALEAPDDFFGTN